MSVKIRTVLFDFGGVIADEGYRNGVREIARMNNLDPEDLAEKTRETLYGTGYLIGRAHEEDFWRALRARTGIQGTDMDLRAVILQRFTVRDWMLKIISWLKHEGVRLAILSDQTNWLDELEANMMIFPIFDYVFNSYHLGKSKIDRSIFPDVLKVMGADPAKSLFIDDTAGHVERAGEEGLNTILFLGREDFLTRLAVFFPCLPRGLFKNQ